MTGAGPGQRVVLGGYREVRDAFRRRDLEQALYHAGGAVMAGSLITLHGDAHRCRRRVENRLFRRGTFRWWERQLVPEVIATSFAPTLSAGRGELVHLGRRTIMHLTALVAGVDRPEDEVRADRLENLARVFSAGATAVHTTRDPAELQAEVTGAMEVFEAEFVGPSRARRQRLLDEHAAGRLAEAELPRDVLTAVLRHRDELGLTDAGLRREVAFYLQAGSHSTANLFTHAAHRIFTGRADPAFAARLGDREFVQRCVHETLRLHPASPVAWRRAVADVRLPEGTLLPAGTLVELDLVAANADPEVWGPDATRFDPDRRPPDGVPPWGHSFGGGMHACIGMELDGGLDPRAEDRDEPVFGTVTLMVEALLRAGARPDPADPPVVDPDSSRTNYARYGIVLDGPARPEEVTR